MTIQKFIVKASDLFWDIFVNLLKKCCYCYINVINIIFKVFHRKGVYDVGKSTFSSF